MKTNLLITIKIALSLFITMLSLTSTAQQDYYWVGGTGNWSDYANHWATTSGGTEFHTTTPTDVDDVYFDENSFTAPGQVVTLDIPGFQDNRIHTMDWRGSTNHPSLVTLDGTDNYLRIHGSLYFQEDMTVDVMELHLQILDGNAEFDPGDVDLTNTDIGYFTSSGASLTLLDSLSTKTFATANVIHGTFTSNGNPIHTTEEFKITQRITGELDISNSTIYTKSFYFRSTVSGSLSTAGLSANIIYQEGLTNTDKTISNYNVHVDHSIVVTSPRFNNLTIHPGVELSIDGFIDQVIFDELNADGTLNEPISIKGRGEAVTLFNNGAEANISYVILQDIEGIGGTFNAYYFLDNGNVSGFNLYRDDQEIAADIETKDYEDIGSIYVPAITASSGLDILLESSNEDVAEVVNGNELLIQGMGTTTITANQTGNIEYNPAVSVSVELEVTKTDQSISFEIPNTWVGEVFINLDAYPSSGLEVSYHIDGGNATIENDVLTFTGVGTVQIRASQAGNENYNAADDVVVSFEVFKADQTITLADILDTWIGDERVTLSGSSSSDLAVTYQINGPATLDGNVLEFTGAGTVQVTASQAGDDNYNATEDEIVTFEVYKNTQTITFAEIADISEDAGFVNLDATSDSGLPVTYSVVGPGEVVDGAMEFIGNGMVQVTAMQAGDDLYLEAEQVRRSFEIIASDTEKPLFLTQPEGLGSIYPNPVADYLHFDPQLNIETIHITDLAGKVYYEGVVEGERLDMSSWEVGTYILTINTTNGEEHVARILKH